jgi:hypothetical protein
MASREQDLLGQLIDTALQPADDDPMFDQYGNTGLIVPGDGNIADDTEEDDAFESLREDLSPGEASEVVETMRPLSEDEREILDTTPGLKPLTRVDDTEHEDWMIENSRRGYQGLDPLLDDAIYGDTMNTREEQMERLGLDSDLGWGLSSLKKLGKRAVRIAKKGITKPGSLAWKYGKKGITTPGSLAWKAAKRVGSLAKKFVPNRDQAKANLVKNLHKKLWVEHANWLGIQDQKAGLPLQPLKYAQVAKLWATNEIQKGGLPTKFAVGRADILGADIMGEDVMGAWWNPFSWFSEKSNIIITQTQGGRSPVGPDGQPTPEGVAPEGMDPSAVAPPSEEPDPEQEASSEGDDQGESDMTTGITGDDSLGAFATEILSGVGGRRLASTGVKDDQFITMAFMHLKTGKPISPMSLARIATASKAGNPRAQKLYAILLKGGAAMAGDDSGAWAHLLNPLYWLKSKQDRKFTDIEKEKWIENAKLQKELGKKKEVLEQAERAKSASEAVAQAKAQAAATEAQLKAIEASLAGELIRDLNADVNGAFVGHDKPTAVTQVVFNALNQVGKRKSADALYGKISKGQPLSPDELKEARQIARLLNRVKVVHGDLITSENDPAMVMHGAFVGACILGGIGAARERNAKLGRAADHLSVRFAQSGDASGKSLSPVEKKVAIKLITETQKLRDFTKAHVSGAAFVGHANATRLRGAAFVGAAKVMSEADRRGLAEIMKLAKAGNPRAVNALAALRKSGEIMGGDCMGFSISKALKYVTAPVWMPAYGLYKGGKYLGKKAFGGRGKAATPEQVRLAQMTAARKRAEAAQARARAADAESEAELRAQQAIASAADAEADAADATALAKEAAMRTKEIEANPELANRGEEGDGDSSGEFIGGWTEVLGKDTKEGKIVAKAAEKSATGQKIRSGAKFYKKMAAGDPKAKAALKIMITKANNGDQQAKRDLNAVWAGRTAVKAKEKAQKKQAVAQARKVRKLKVIAVQRKFEAGIANKLVRTERRMKIAKYARVEAKAARGNKRACAYVAKQVAASKKGDKKATARVNAMKLGRTVRLAAPTKRERRNLAVAGKVIARAKRNDPKAIRQIAVTRAAAKQGNPNAKRAVKRLEVAAVVFTAVETGMIVGSRTGKKQKKAKTSHAATVALAKKKKAAGSGTREEYTAGARAAQALGDKQTAGELALAASSAPSATELLKKTATVYAAKEEGNPEAKAAIVKSFEAAKTGDPIAIKKTANVVAVQAIDDLNKGKPLSPTMVDAVNLNERIAAGDPIAIAEAKKITEEATKPNPMPEATIAAVTLGAAAITARALASKPAAKAEFLAKVNPPMNESEAGTAKARLNTLVAQANDGTITPEQGVEGVRLASRLGLPRVAAEISSKAPPMEYGMPLSTLPDMPLAPITGVYDLVKESLKAITFSTRDPLANYKGGIAARAKTPVSSSAADSDSGWSPFGIFKAFARNAAIIAPATGIVASAASLAMAMNSRKAPRAPAPAPVAATVATPAPVQMVTAHADSPSAAALSAQPAAVEGATPPSKEALAPTSNLAKSGMSPPKDATPPMFTTPSETMQKVRAEYDKADILPPTEELTRKQLIQHALNNKKMSKDEFNKVAAGKPQNAKKLLAFLTSKGVTVGSTSTGGAFVGAAVGADKSFKDYMTNAIKSKKMTKADFNKAMEHHLGKKATAESKTASGEKVLKFLTSKGVKIEK